VSNTRQIIERVAFKLDISKRLARSILDQVVDEIAADLSFGEPVSIAGLGRFDSKGFKQDRGIKKRKKVKKQDRDYKRTVSARVSKMPKLNGTEEERRAKAGITVKAISKRMNGK